MSIFKISKTFVFFLTKSSEYLTWIGQGSIFMIRFQGSVVKTDPCQYLLKISPDVLNKKTKVLDIFNTDKNVDKGIRIRFLEKKKQIPITDSYLLYLMLVYWVVAPQLNYHFCLIEFQRLPLKYIKNFNFMKLIKQELQVFNPNEEKKVSFEMNVVRAESHDF